MKVFINTFQTDSSYLHQMNDSEDYIMCEEEIEATDETFPVCLSLEDENGNIIASSGCYPEFPILTKSFVKYWFEGDFSEIEIIEAIDGILWEQDLGFMPITENNQLPSPPQEITTFTDKFGNVYDSLEACEEGEKQHINSELHYQALEEEYQNVAMAYQLEEMEREARQNLRKHVLVKRKDMQPRVDFQLLVNSSSDIWNAGHLLGISEDPNNPTVKLGQDSVKNLMLFFKLMSNPKFATRASFEIEKILNK